MLYEVITMFCYHRSSLPLVRTSRQLLAEINGQLNESLQGMAVVRAFNRARQSLASLDDLNERQRQARMKELRLNGLLLRPLIELLRITSYNVCYTKLLRIVVIAMLPDLLKITPDAPPVSMAVVIQMMMLCFGGIILLVTKTNPGKVPNGVVFKSGMVAAIRNNFV